MASNSRREQILVAVVSALDGISAINHVQRHQPEDPTFKDFTEQQMPVIAVIGGVTQPKYQKSGRGKGQVDLIISDLPLELFIYYHNNVDPDTQLSSLLDDIWAALFTDITLGLSFVQDLVIYPKKSVLRQSPYHAFALDCSIEYNHTKGGI